MKNLIKTSVSALAILAMSNFAFAGDIPYSVDDVKGDITYYTHWTNYIASGDFDRWEAEFKAMYPNVGDVDISGIATYAETISTRLATGDYGDVLDTPRNVALDELPDFFLPLTDLGMNDDFYFASNWAVDGEPYAFTFGVNVEGLVYNKAAFAKAGVTDVPQTRTDLIAAMHKLKDADIVPIVLNMGSAWPLSTFDGLAVAISGDADYFNQMLDDESPWAADKPYGMSFGLLKQFVEEGLVEEDLTGDHWQDSKGWMASGKAAMWFLGNWSINQIILEGSVIEGLENYDANNIGYFPLPYDDSGKINVNSGPDYGLSVAANSQNPITAKAWLAFLLSKTDISQISGFIPSYKSLPATLPQLAELSSYGPTIIEKNVDDPKFTEAVNLIDFGGGHGARDVMLADDYAAAIAKLNGRWAQASQRVKR